MKLQSATSTSYALASSTDGRAEERIETEGDSLGQTLANVRQLVAQRSALKLEVALMRSFVLLVRQLVAQRSALKHHMGLGSWSRSSGSTAGRAEERIETPQQSSSP